MSNQQIAKENKALLKSLDINTRNLVSYHILYKTTPFTFVYKDSSMWAYSINKDTKQVEVNTTYFGYTQKIADYNQTKYDNV